MQDLQPFQVVSAKHVNVPPIREAPTSANMIVIESQFFNRPARLRVKVFDEPIQAEPKFGQVWAALADGQELGVAHLEFFNGPGVDC
jgi:hypothetical protein